MIGAFVPPMLAHVCDIVSSRAPAEIFKRVVACITVKVAAFIALWSRSDKCFQNDVMDVSKASSTQSDHLPTVLVVGHGAQFSPAIGYAPAIVSARPYGAIGAGTVARVVWDVLVGKHLSVVPPMDR